MGLIFATKGITPIRVVRCVHAKLRMIGILCTHLRRRVCIVACKESLRCCALITETKNGYGLLLQCNVNEINPSLRLASSTT